MVIGGKIPASTAFPNLTPGNHAITSDRSTAYNCIAWAAGDVSRWWWPIDIEDVYWPEAIPRVENLRSFVAAFATLGYDECQGGDWVPALEKVAIYTADGIPRHAARQLSDGRWSSKLGKSVDLTHSLEAIAGPAYGEPALFLSRQVAS